MRKVGILGGGQLGTMLAEALFALDAQVRMYDADPQAPGVRRLREAVSAPWSDQAAVARFVQGLDVLTYEFEHIDGSPLRALGDSLRIVPSIRVLEVTQDRALEKQFLAASGLPHAAFAVARSEAELREAANRLGYPFILKTIRGGYDGKGQFHVAGHEDLDAAILALRERKSDFSCVLEEIIDLAVEVSCIVARDGTGAEVTFPLFENAHEGHILDLTLVPARVPAEVAAVVREVALRTARAVDLEGVLCIEFFVGRSAARRSSGLEAAGLHVYVNELAPRPHNSGHVTRNACTASQYDVLARVLLGLPLHEPQLVDPTGSYCMGNLLGDVWIEQGRGAPGQGLDLGCWKDHPSVVDVVLYGKTEPKPRRKMGHFVVRAADADTALAEARAFRDHLRGR
ncbi:MAG: ATP-grasp domain-containing protein [Myxococcales bacterium]|nr:ATP-grasp domain-containing protein [Myxococcales bacterium]